MRYRTLPKNHHRRDDHGRQTDHRQSKHSPAAGIEARTVKTFRDKTFPPARTARRFVQPARGPHLTDRLVVVHRFAGFRGATIRRRQSLEMPTTYAFSGHISGMIRLVLG
ncbi:hypothetical protein ACFYT3_14990 [Nocardia amikacinitolerans]|uniref:hypothetical protein n=1 Tax=Nocardia amikacinitolerans TaxID=756689 RepID=UPI0027E335A7|nr:hypothetical protein [Nocardia amikacinitolerans]